MVLWRVIRDEMLVIASHAKSESYNFDLMQLAFNFLVANTFIVFAFKGALSRYFTVILQCRNMFLHQWKPKNNDAVLLPRTLSLHRNDLLLPIT